jgi:hypothetical protein
MVQPPDEGSTAAARKPPLWRTDDGAGVDFEVVEGDGDVVGFEGPAKSITKPVGLVVVVAEPMRTNFVPSW